MNAFRKQSRASAYEPKSGLPATVEVFSSKQVLTKGDPYPRSFIERKEVTVEEYADKLGLPSSEDYTLEAILRSGQSPEFVNVSGMLDSADPLDASNSGAAVTLFDRLQTIEESQKAPVVTPAAPDVATVVEPKSE